QARAEADTEALRLARAREQAEARSIKVLNDRLQAERKSEALAAERAEAESRATAQVQARIAAEEALARKSLEAAEAAERAAQARSERASEETRLWRLRGAPWQRRPVLLALGAAVLLSLLLGVYVGLRQPHSGVPLDTQAPAEPLKLRLERGLAEKPAG
ncbi:MAG TPA: hypothetical protein VHG88_03990, partial [Burkholderiales bacterium]|nr:hypothetical protein [Burkholderiales bacterium]